MDTSLHIRIFKELILLLFLLFSFFLFFLSAHLRRNAAKIMCENVPIISEQTAPHSAGMLSVPFCAVLCHKCARPKHVPGIIPNMCREIAENAHQNVPGKKEKGKKEKGKKENERNKLF